MYQVIPHRCNTTQIRDHSAEADFLATLSSELAQKPEKLDITAIVTRLYPSGWHEIAETFQLEIAPETDRPIDFVLTDGFVAAVIAQARVVFDAEGADCYPDFDGLTCAQTLMANYAACSDTDGPLSMAAEAITVEFQPENAMWGMSNQPKEEGTCSLIAPPFVTGLTLLGRPTTVESPVLGIFLRPGQVSVVGGPSGAGKTALVMGWAVAIAAGVDFGADAVPKASRVIYVNNEDGTDELRRRMIAAARVQELDEAAVAQNILFRESDELFRISSHDPLVARRHLRELVRAAKKFKADLIIFDPLVEFHEHDENDNRSMNALVESMRYIARTSKVAVLAVHHVTKGGVPGDKDALRGAGALVGAARACRTLYEVGTKNEPPINRHIAPERLRDHVRVDDAKLNYARRSPYPHLFERQEVEVDGVPVVALRPLGLDLPLEEDE